MTYSKTGIHNQGNNTFLQNQTWQLQTASITPRRLPLAFTLQTPMLVLLRRGGMLQQTRIDVQTVLLLYDNNWSAHNC